MRRATHDYTDPLDQIWLETAARIGLRVERRGDVYASLAGSTLTLGNPETLDPDDCLAQMIFHELCHSLVEGADAFEQPDWGLDNMTERDTPREYACLRLQAFLADRVGLRQFLAPTTEHRSYYDALPADPLADRQRPEVAAAILGAQRARTGPWAPHLQGALEATQKIAAITGSVSRQVTSLFQVLAPVRALHRSGVPNHVDPSLSCRGCAWVTAEGGCRQFGAVTVELSEPACERYEADLDCQRCGACCRAAYHSVEVQPTDPVVKRHPDLVVARESYLELKRSGDRCGALEGELAAGFGCRIYEDRPETCRDFERGGDHCVTARRRVGLSL